MEEEVGAPKAGRGLSRRNGLILVLALVALFLAFNRASYKGYFTDDDFDNLSWTRHAPLTAFIKGLLTPALQTNNFRPTGHFFYRVEGQLFGFDFHKYLAATHLLHFLNVWLVWLVVRRLGARPFAAAAGCALFALHTGYFEAVWKPSYIFDVLCATFCLLSLLNYMRGRLLLSFVCFWLGFKSKELAVMLPFVLICYELWFGRKRWQPLVPFFIVSASFGLQALVFAPDGGPGNGYAFHFTVEALALTSVFYAGRTFLFPYSGFLLFLGAYFTTNRKIWFGTAAMILFLTPVLFLPGRIENGYVYLPFTGLAIALAGAAELCHPAVILAGFLLFTPLAIRDLRIQRSDKLAKDDDVRTWVTTWRQYTAKAGPINTFSWNGAPYGFGAFGLEGAIKCLYPHDRFKIQHHDLPPVKVPPDRTAFLTWNSSLHKLDIVEHAPNTRDESYIDTSNATPVWQLGDGWSNPEGGFRWSAPVATAKLNRPEGASRFELKVLVSSALLQNSPAVTLQATIDGSDLAPQRLTQTGWQTVTWDLPAAPAGEAQISLHTDPPYHAPGDPRILGVPVASFGFR